MIGEKNLIEIHSISADNHKRWILIKCIYNKLYYPFDFTLCFYIISIS